MLLSCACAHPAGAPSAAAKLAKPTTAGGLTLPLRSDEELEVDVFCPQCAWREFEEPLPEADT
jgi:hypothetical protein